MPIIITNKIAKSYSFYKNDCWNNNLNKAEIISFACIFVIVIKLFSGLLPDEYSSKLLLVLS